MEIYTSVKNALLTDLIQVHMCYPELHLSVFEKMIPTSWIKLVITEGKNRQVRRMTAKVGFPTLRLIRYRIEGLTLNGLRSGDMSELEKRTIYHSLFGE